MGKGAYMLRTKKVFWTFLLLLCMGFIACTNNRIEHEEDANPEVITDIDEIAEEPETNSQEDTTSRIKKVIKHDAGFSDDGTTWDLITEYEYSQEGYLIREISYNSEGELQDDSVEYSYDNNGKMVRKNNYVNDCLIGYVLCEYNQEKQLIKEELYRLNDSSDSFEMTGKIEYTYDSNGNLIKNENDGISISIKNSYDEKNRIIKKECSNGLQEKYYYVSEESELVGKKVVTVPAYSTTYNYTYDSNRNLIEEIIESDNGNSPERITYEYEDID
jgi:hypothetical protein